MQFEIKNEPNKKKEHLWEVPTLKKKKLKKDLAGLEMIIKNLLNFYYMLFILALSFQISPLKKIKTTRLGCLIGNVFV